MSERFPVELKLFQSSPLNWSELYRWLSQEIGENWRVEWHDKVAIRIFYFNTEEDRVKFILKWL